MPVRVATTAWQGGLHDGAGTTSASSSGVGSFPVSFPRRAADSAEGVTSPEELIAMAHSACLAMQLSALISEHGATSVQLDVTAEVALGPDPAGGFRLMGIDLAVTGSAAGLDAGAFAELTETAKRICPVSKALTGVEISLATTFVPA